MHCVPMGTWDTTILIFCQFNKILVILKFIHMLRKFTCRHLSNRCCEFKKSWMNNFWNTGYLKFHFVVLSIIRWHHWNNSYWALPKAKSCRVNKNMWAMPGTCGKAKCFLLQTNQSRFCHQIFRKILTFILQDQRTHLWWHLPTIPNFSIFPQICLNALKF